MTKYKFRFHDEENIPDHVLSDMREKTDKCISFVLDDKTEPSIKLMALSYCMGRIIAENITEDDEAKRLIFELSRNIANFVLDDDEDDN